MNRSAKATIFHNPMCGTSRKTLDILREEGRDVWIREYLKDPPTRAELKAMYAKAGLDSAGIVAKVFEALGKDLRTETVKRG